VTYSNSGELACTNQCKDKGEAGFITATDGECKPVNTDPAINGPDCVPNDDCSFIEIWQPVCGSDGVTYSNSGELACANQCKDKGEAGFITATDGECKPVNTDPAINGPNCVPNPDCGFIGMYQPVCGSDGVTYSNSGELACANQCKDKGEAGFITATDGECKPVPVNPTEDCDPTDCYYPEIYEPVCGSDRITYPNDQALSCANTCLEEDDVAYVTEISKGKCSNDLITIAGDETECKPSNCVYISTNEPVCGADGITYDNEAALDCANACKETTASDYIWQASKGTCASPENSKYCPAAEPEATSASSCDFELWSNDCYYDSYACEGFVDYTRYNTKCTCEQGFSIGGGGNGFLTCGANPVGCPKSDAPKTCPKEAPTHGDQCAFGGTEQVCYYNPVHCNGKTDILFEDECSCVNGFFSCVSQAEARNLICIQDPEDDSSRCPINIPFSEELCTKDGLICPYQPYHCPEDDPSEAFFLSECECSDGEFQCAVSLPKQCAVDSTGGETSFPAFCFPGDATVDVLNQGLTRMEDLKVGDSIRTTSSADKYERIYSFGHYNKDRTAEFIEFTTATKNKLSLSSVHLVYEQTQQAYIPASDVKIGHTLVENGEASEVTKIRTVQRKGLYAPFTSSGSLVVNGVLASSFIDVLPSVGNSQWIAHTGEFPHRFWCTTVADCSSESYDEQGINYYWGRLPMNFLAWLSTQNKVVQFLVQMGLMLALTVLYTMEKLWTMNNLMTVGLLGLAAAFLSHRRFTIKKKNI